MKNLSLILLIFASVLIMSNSAMKCYIGRDDIDIRFDSCRDCDNCKCYSLERNDGIMEYGCEDSIESIGCDTTIDGHRCLCDDDLCNYSMIDSKSTKMTSSLLLIGYGFLQYFYLL
nr:uncharacterized protein LOC121116085 isoform X2 [Lepeophtheirus salmonis]